MKKKWWKSRSKQEKLGCLVSGILGLLLCLFLWKESAEATARWIPDYPKMDVSSIDFSQPLSSEEETLLLQQTGLTAIGLERLLEAQRQEDLEVFQRAFFLEGIEVEPQEAIGVETPFTWLPMTCFQNSPISWEEYLLDTEGNRGAYLPIVPLEEGDILVTPNSHSFGYRQGHAALVVDVEQWLTLECLVLGQNSVTQHISKWLGFPAVAVFRPKNRDLAPMAVEYAMDYLLDVPYDLTVGVFSEKDLPLGELARGTQCSHLVWQAYHWAGVDIDANGWGLVTPFNLSQSEHLELVQIWGMNPEKLWC